MQQKNGFKLLHVSHPLISLSPDRICQAPHERSRSSCCCRGTVGLCRGYRRVCLLGVQDYRLPRARSHLVSSQLLSNYFKNFKCNCPVVELRLVMLFDGKRFFSEQNATQSRLTATALHDVVTGSFFSFTSIPYGFIYIACEPMSNSQR